MTCKPVNKIETSKTVAMKMIPPRIICVDTRHKHSKLCFDADANQRVFLEEILSHLIEDGWIFPWDYEDISPFDWQHTGVKP